MNYIGVQKTTERMHTIDGGSTFEMVKDQFVRCICQLKEKALYSSFHHRDESPDKGKREGGVVEWNTGDIAQDQ